jgi:molybdopterin converting factor small subunit
MFLKKIWIIFSISFKSFWEVKKLNVTFQLHTALQIQTPAGRVTSLQCKIQSGQSVEQALQALGLQIDPEGTLIVVDHQNVDLDYRPKDGDIIHLIPAIAGG